MSPSSGLTPMFRQYRALKEDHPGAILLFRMGDFYEMFYEDAQTASRLLEITLTARGRGTKHEAPMCGFPHHQLESYTARLVRSGHRVAICEQTEDPKKAKGLVRREVIRVVTPGTLTDPDQLDARSNHWIAGVARVEYSLGAAFLDASTGEFLAWQEPPDSDGWEALAGRMQVFKPREIVHPEGFPWAEAGPGALPDGALLTAQDSWGFAASSAGDLLVRHLGVASLDGFGMRDRPAAVAAAGGLLLYLQDTQRSGLEHVDTLSLHEPASTLLLDPATRRNLEIERSLRDAGRRGTLFEAVDATVTPGGARMLRAWLGAPLLDPRRIAARQDAVEEFLEHPARRAEARERLQGVRDVERLLGRAVAGTANARDLQGLCASLERLPALIGSQRDARAPLTREVVEGLDPCEDLAALLARGIVEDPPAGLRDGGLIRDGFSDELDELRSIARDGKSYISSLETRERRRTGIGSLKVRFNKVFGYFIEVSKSNLHLVPEDYRRKQTIASGERYVTPELKDYEARVLNAQERIESLEYELFCTLRGEVVARAQRLKAASRATSTLDVLCSLAESAANHGYRRPQVHDGTVLSIKGGRHPVVEQVLSERGFVPNDTSLDALGHAIAILTGPNMGGKSTYLRQVALIVLLAQSGSFVPAEEAEIGVVDRIFCRVGASDSLAEGQSTFMVEMTETANILHNATPRSLILLDEIGRGTSTFDGLSIAWAVVEELHGRDGGRPRTLFATHYHELTELEVELDAVVNYRMGVREWGDDVVFLHRVESGASDRSYGIQVARLAGVPPAVVERAREILTNLERDEYGQDGLPRRARGSRTAGAARRTQPSLFENRGGERTTPEEPDAAVAEVLAELRTRDPERTTPLEALEILARWKKRLSRR